MMARSSKGSAPRAPASPRGGRSRPSTSVGGTTAETSRDDPGGRELFEDVTEAFAQELLLGPGDPLRRLTTLFLLQLVDWHSAVLEFYQRALRDGCFDGPAEDYLRKMARTMMGAYLDLVKSAPERRERLLAGQAELARVLSETLDNLRRRLSESSP
jgi:hypothetical protein